MKHLYANGEKRRVLRACADPRCYRARVPARLGTLLDLDNEVNLVSNDAVLPVQHLSGPVFGVIFPQRILQIVCATAHPPELASVKNMLCRRDAMG